MSTTDHALSLPFVYNRELQICKSRPQWPEITWAKWSERNSRNHWNFPGLTTQQITRAQGKLPLELTCEPLDTLTRFVESSCRALLEKQRTARELYQLPSL